MAEVKYTFDRRWWVIKLFEAQKAIDGLKYSDTELEVAYNEWCKVGHSFLVAEVMRVEALAPAAAPPYMKEIQAALSIPSNEVVTVQKGTSLCATVVLNEKELLTDKLLWYHKLFDLHSFKPGDILEDGNSYEWHRKEYDRVYWALFDLNYPAQATSATVTVAPVIDVVVEKPRHQRLR